MDYLKVASLLEQLAQEFRAAGSTAKPEAPAVALQTKPEGETVKLALLQSYGRSLLTQGHKDLLMKILEDRKLANLSSAPPALYPELKKDLQDALHKTDIPF